MSGPSDDDKEAATRAFTVVLEDLRSKFEVFGEGLKAVDQKLDRVDARLSDKLQKLEDKVDVGFAQSERRFEAIDARFEGIERDLGLVKTAVLEHNRALRDVRGGR